MYVRDLLAGKSSAITIEPGRDIATAVQLLMRHHIGGLPVVTRAGSLVGFLAERDVVRIVDAAIDLIRSMTVEQVMRRPAPVCAVDDSLHEVMARMTRERMRHFVVLDEDHIAGVISVGDLVKHRLEQLETEAGVLRDYVAAQRARTERPARRR
ncbi:MAG: CBS domain-containing protein [Longimicrobiales bacterium]